LEEIHRRTKEQLRRANETLAKSDERFRDLFDEAPVAYVIEDLDTRIIRANRAAMRILGATPEDIPGTYGKSFVRKRPKRSDARVRRSNP